MKRTVSLFLSCLFLMSLAACGEPGAERTPAPTPSESPAVTATPEPPLSALVSEDKIDYVMKGPSGSILLVKGISNDEYTEMMRLMYPNGIVDSQGLEIGPAENCKEIRADFVAEHTKAYSVQGTEMIPVPITPYTVTFPSRTGEKREALFYRAEIGRDQFLFPSEGESFGLFGFAYRSERGIFLANIDGICRIDPATMTAEKRNTDTYQGKTIEEVREDLKTGLGSQLAWINQGALSPDGRTVVYRTNRDTDALNNTSIWKLDLDTGEEKQLVAPAAWNDLVGFLTDDCIVVGSLEDTRMVEVSTGKVTPLIFPELPHFNIRSIGGGKVIYTSYTDDTPGSTVYVGRVDGETGAVTELARATGYFGDPVFSPDWDKVAVGYGADPEKGTKDVLVLDLLRGTQTMLTDCPTPAASRLAEDPAMEGAYIYRFVWLDDNTILVRPRGEGEASTTIPIPEATPEPTPNFTEEERRAGELEFSLVVGDQFLSLGKQLGAFPWGAELEADSEEYWSMDGFYSFRLTCGEDLLLEGHRPNREVETPEDGWLSRIENRDPAYTTYRGAYIGMSLEELQLLYPEVEQAKSGADVVYTFSDERRYGFRLLAFFFEDDVLTEFRLVNGMDGFTY